MTETMCDAIVSYFNANEKSGVTVRDVQSHLNISAKSARELLEKYGKQHTYKGSGMSYVLDRTKQPKLVQIDLEKQKAKDLQITRKYILEWLEEGNVDIEAWALDETGRPPHDFIREDYDS